MSHDPLEPILKRASCRAYLPDPIPDDDLERLLMVMRMAPSAGNMQPWKFLIVRSEQDRTALSKAAYDQEFLIQAPIVIVVCGDAARSASRYGSRGRELYVLQDTAAATENLLIAATALGYGTCWVGAFDEEEVSIALSIPADLRPLAMVPVGRAAEGSHSPHRRPMREIVEMR